MRRSTASRTRRRSGPKHGRTEFAFSPLYPNVDDTYGNTSMTVEWISRNAEWRVVGLDRSLDDEYQVYVFLRPA